MNFPKRSFPKIEKENSLVMGLPGAKVDAKNIDGKSTDYNGTYIIAGQKVKR